MANRNHTYLPIFLLCLCVFSCLATGCQKNKATTKTTFDYTGTAEQLFEKAAYAFDRERWNDAEKMFTSIRRQYPYSRFAATAELRSADCLYSQGSYAEAVVAYQHFLKTYPTHPEASHAMFRKAAAHFRQIPKDFFLLPPSYERDRSATREARSALLFFLHHHPDTQWTPEAQEMLVETENALVRYEMYVARFYLKRRQLKSATLRLDGIGRVYTQSPLVPDAMLLQATTCLRMGAKARAQSIFNDIVTLYPAHHQALRAKKYMAELSAGAPN